MSLAAMSLADCPAHGPSTLHEFGACVCCRPKRKEHTYLESQSPIGSYSPQSTNRAWDSNSTRRRRKQEPMIGAALASEFSGLERQVYDLYVSGMGPVAIGDRLGVGEFAASHALDRVVRKTGVGGREQLRAKA